MTGAILRALTLEAVRRKLYDSPARQRLALDVDRALAMLLHRLVYEEAHHLPTKPGDKSLAQIAFEAQREGDLAPTWDSLGPVNRARWAKVAQAVAQDLYDLAAELADEQPETPGSARHVQLEIRRRTFGSIDAAAAAVWDYHQDEEDADG